MVQFHRSEAVFDQHRAWKWRVILASIPTTTGVIVRAMLGKTGKQGMAFGSTADIAADGQVMTMFRSTDGTWRGPIPIGSIGSVRDNLRRLADHCKLDDPDREALFEELRKWIRRDYRATSEPR